MVTKQRQTIRQRIKSRMKGLAALAIALMMVVSMLPVTEAKAAETGNYYFAISYGDEDGILGNGTVAVTAVNSFAYKDSNNPKFQTGITELGTIGSTENSPAITINPEADTTFYYGGVQSGYFRIYLDGTEKTTGYNCWWSNYSSFDLPAGKYTVQHTSTNKEGQWNDRVWKIEVNTVIESIKLSSSSLNFTIGDPAQQLTVTPDTAKVNWSSNDETVATVDPSGNVKPVGAGKADITAALTSDPNVKATCTVSVKAAGGSELTENQKPKGKTDLKETGTEQLLVTEPTEKLPEGYTMNYALGKDATTVPTDGWSTSVPTAKSAGTYYVWYKAVGDASHPDSAAGCITVTVSANQGGDQNPSNVHSVKGIVNDGNGAVSGAMVTVTPGGKTATTDEKGMFTIEGLEDGNYNICAEKDGKKTTVLVTVSGQNVDIPGDSIVLRSNNSEVVTGKEASGDNAVKTSGVKVAGMDQLAKESAAENATYKMQIDGKNYDEVKDNGGSTITNYANQAYADLGSELNNSLKLAWLDMSIYKNNQYYNTTNNRINVMEVLIPYDMTGKNSLLVWRYHDGNAVAFTQNGSGADGTFSISGSGANAEIHVFSQFFSTYALSYSTGSAVTSFRGYGSGGGAVGGGSSSSSGGTNGVISVDGNISGGTAATVGSGQTAVTPNGSGLQAGASVAAGTADAAANAVNAAGVAAANGKTNPNGKANPGAADGAAAPKTGDPIDGIMPILYILLMSGLLLL